MTAIQLETRLQQELSRMQGNTDLLQQMLDFARSLVAKPKDYSPTCELPADMVCEALFAAERSVAEGDYVENSAIEQYVAKELAW